MYITAYIHTYVHAIALTNNQLEGLWHYGHYNEITGYSSTARIQLFELHATSLLHVVAKKGCYSPHVQTLLTELKTVFACSAM